MATCSCRLVSSCLFCLSSVNFPPAVSRQANSEAATHTAVDTTQHCVYNSNILSCFYGKPISPSTSSTTTQPCSMGPPCKRAKHKWLTQLHVNWQVDYPTDRMYITVDPSSHIFSFQPVLHNWCNKCQVCAILSVAWCI